MSTIYPLDHGRRVDTGEDDAGISLDKGFHARLVVYPGIRDAAHVDHLKENLNAVQVWLAEWEEKITQGIYPNADKGWEPIIGTRTREEHWEGFVKDQKYRAAELQRAIEGAE